jgi:hypothetical protein
MTSSHITFTLGQGVVPLVSLTNKIIPPVKYLGLLLDKRLTWADHIKQKCFLLNSRRKYLYSLLGKQSKLNFNNKLLLYKILLNLTWAYDIQLWGTAKKSNIYKMQTFQSISPYNHQRSLLCHKPYSTRRSWTTNCSQSGLILLQAVPLSPHKPPKFSYSCP